MHFAMFWAGVQSSLE